MTHWCVFEIFQPAAVPLEGNGFLGQMGKTLCTKSLWFIGNFYSLDEWQFGGLIVFDQDRMRQGIKSIKCLPLPFCFLPVSIGVFMKQVGISFVFYAEYESKFWTTWPKKSDEIDITIALGGTTI